MLYRTRYTVVGLIAVAFLSTLIISCNPVQRHKVLTFFFDGVPPLGGREVVAEASATTNMNFQPGQTTPPAQPKVVWFIHEPQKDCAGCHGSRKRRGFSTEVKLVTKVPELCYECHEGFSAMQGWVHGPVAAGQCLICHDPHKSENEHLLKCPIPELCNFCHEKEEIALVPDHSEEAYLMCNNCHESHTSSERSLLKTGWEEKVY